jgi:hypothetical protein
MYRKLDPQRIVASLEVLHNRIEERLPGAGLAKVCAELTVIARQSAARADRIAAPNIALRIAVFAILATGVALLVYVASLIDYRKTGDESVFSVLQGVEATMNIFVLMGAAIWALITLEERPKRRRALAALHELRSITHVIDMHQLTKDPAAAAHGSNDTPSSPSRTLPPFLLVRYLDYCSEMLSMVAKVAALYAQSLPDPIVTEAVNEIEQVATNLSNKIWQKITIIEVREGRETSMGTGAGVATVSGRDVPIASHADAEPTS